MIIKRIIISLLAMLILSPSASRAGDIIDLTHPFNEQTIYWPTAGGFEMEKRGWKVVEDGYFYAANIIKLPEHGGTHLDAPIHFAEGKWTVDQIPVEKLFGPLAVIHLKDKIAGRADYQISKKDIMAWEGVHAKITSENIVLFSTGWEAYWDNKKKYLGSDTFGDTKNLHFPGIGKDAANYLAGKKIKGVGLDTASLDYGQSRDFITHRILLEANIYGLENVHNLNKLPATGARLIVAPMKIEKGTGGPTRVFAILP